MKLNDLDEVVALLVSQPLRHQPGEGYTYGMRTAVLGRAVEVLSGMPLADFLEKEIFAPLGMKQTRFFLTKEDRKRFQPLFVKEGITTVRERLRKTNFTIGQVALSVWVGKASCRV